MIWPTIMPKVTVYVCLLQAIPEKFLSGKSKPLKLYVNDNTEGMVICVQIYFVELLNC